jgi:hypothetical protein
MRVRRRVPPSLPPSLPPSPLVSLSLRFPPPRSSRRDAAYTVSPHSHSPPLIPSVRMLGAHARGAGVHCLK